MRALSASGYDVTALVRRRSAELESRQVVGTLDDAGALARAMDGHRFLVHCAALYSFAPSLRAQMQRVNVGGTAGVLEAAHAAGVERAIVTSSSSTVGPSQGGTPVDERSMPADHDAPSSYHASKRAQERAALSARVPVVLLLPSAPVGPGDAAPTPTGAVVRDFARGSMFSLPPAGGINLVPVEDVAGAHAAALTMGRPGERYLLGGENLTLDALWNLLAVVTNRHLPRVRVPVPLLTALAYADELRSRTLRTTPVVPLEGLRMAQDLMYVDSSKAARELGFRPGSVRSALARAVAWYRTRAA